jgi:hypothetical protein
VWEGVLPERRDVEEKEREHMGGKWVKRPKRERRVAKFGVPLEALGFVLGESELCWQRMKI